MEAEMNLTIPLSPAVKIALETEASVKKSLEQAGDDVIDTFFTLHGVHEDGYDAWFEAKVEEGLEAARQGKFLCGHEISSCNSMSLRYAWHIRALFNQQFP